MTKQYYIANHFPASTEPVQRLLAAPAGGGKFIDPDTGSLTNEEDTRSEWVWLRLANGDLMLGFFPQGDWGYFGSEVAVEEDYARAEREGRVSELHAEDVETKLDLLVAKLTELAEGWSRAADEIRPTPDPVYGFDNSDEMVNDAIAEQLDECATQVLQAVEHPEHVGEDHPAYRPVGADSE